MKYNLNIKGTVLTVIEAVQEYINKELEKNIKELNLEELEKFTNTTRELIDEKFRKVLFYLKQNLDFYEVFTRAINKRKLKLNPDLLKGSSFIKCGVSEGKEGKMFLSLIKDDFFFLFENYKNILENFLSLIEEMEIEYDSEEIKNFIEKVLNDIKTEVLKLLEKIEGKFLKQEYTLEVVEEGNKNVEEGANIEREELERELILEEPAEVSDVDEMKKESLIKVLLKQKKKGGKFFLKTRRKKDELFKCDIGGYYIENTDFFPKFKGVLLYFGEPSEYAPSVGSKYPLLITREIAEQIVEFINKNGGIPLDADEDFRDHRDENIVGVIEKAYIEGNKIIVEGKLFKFNKRKIVEKIQKYKNNLGMSITGIGDGKVIDYKGKKVTLITEMKPLGACILRKEQATWPNTEVLKAHKKNENSNIEKDILYKEITMSKNNEFLVDTLFELGSSIKELAEAVKTELESLNKKIGIMEETVNKRIEEINNEIVFKSSRDKQRESMLNEMYTWFKENFKDKQNQKKETVEDRQKLLEEIKNEVVKTLAPDGVTNRKTVSLVSASNSSEEINEIEKRLISAEATLKTMEQMGVVGPERIKLLEEISSLKAALGRI